LISCRQATSGLASENHFSTVSNRALTELTFQVAMRMGLVCNGPARDESRFGVQR